MLFSHIGKLLSSIVSDFHLKINPVQYNLGNGEPHLALQLRSDEYGLGASPDKPSALISDISPSGASDKGIAGRDRRGRI